AQLPSSLHAALPISISVEKGKDRRLEHGRIPACNSRDHNHYIAPVIVGDRDEALARPASGRRVRTAQAVHPANLDGVARSVWPRSEEHTSELQSPYD